MRAALKEWAIAVDALTQGETILLLRKGGIREEQGHFTVAHRQVWLYPTYEHQQPHLLKSPYHQQVQPVASGWHPEVVLIKAWAEVTDIFAIDEAETVMALLPFHIWNEAFVSDRLRWKPRQPLYGLLLRVYALEAPVTIPYRVEYGGCKSWIDELAIAPPQIPTHPVLPNDYYTDLSDQIRRIV